MYELLKGNKALIKKLVRLGVADPIWLRDIEMYEEYLNLNIRCIMCKYSIIAEKYKLSESSVRKRIKMMEKAI